MSEKIKSDIVEIIDPHNLYFGFKIIALRCTGL